ncbi:TPA: hypothetical protein JBA76_03495 [Legionella pneumophila subsp. pneumophila]|uniref:Uncharacterized protein n=1 Tax=Legionella pneumophila TaxID=446 RepID=A0AAP3HEU4_LEGPN|nr:hypothetical protein [Legionella pneumophila]HAT8848376.1 hypothetical protein [Legionella pneumophila subsp. pneumophila]MCK1858398.1 hypothetical protein [Legionella pneumophila]MCZ4691367.1 hypothetical protein [Legionella pneumophila]MCZ4711041.1 hypothetical protein [Legionella pneumophila]MCZ4719832.1 hypothetical protein [Legionella pneumophila]
MNNTETDDAFNELNNLLQLLLPELNAFKDLVKDMAKVDSPYQKSFNHIVILLNMTESQIQSNIDIQKTIILIVKELNSFSQILDKISTDHDVIELYSKGDLLDKCVNLQTNLIKKFGSS